MRYLYLYIISSILSLFIMTFIMIFVFDKPLIVGWGKVAYDKKYEHFMDNDGSGGNVVIVAGSNGFFSHRCEEIEKALRMNCTNYSVSAGLGLSYILEKSKEVITNGSLVILPLEYNFYNGNREESIKSNLGNVHILENDIKYLFDFGVERSLYIIFSKDFKYIFGSILENILDVIGFQRRFNISTLNDNGDMVGHTREKSEPYMSYVYSQSPVRPTLNVCNDNYYKDLIAKYIDYVHSIGGQVYGSYPTTFKGKLSDDEKKALKCIYDLYKKNGAGFIELDNNSMYPKESFYDTAYHLNEQSQIKHSEKIAEYLNQVLMFKD